MEERKIEGKDLEASYLSPMVTQDGESAQPILEWKTEYTHFEEGPVDQKARDSRWHRRIQCFGHMALLMLIWTSIYLVFYTQGFDTS